MMTVSGSVIVKKTVTPTGGNARKSVTKVSAPSRKSVSKGTTAFVGTNITDLAYGVGAYGINEYAGISHFRNRTRPEINHD